MNIHVYSSRKNVQETLVNAIRFAAQALDVQDVQSIHIDMEEEMPFFLLGGCIPDSEHQSFTIQLNNSLDDNLLLETLFHEMVHLKQYSKGELSESKTSMIWKNKTYLKNNQDNRHLPWEEEAYRLEKELLNHYLINN